MSLDGVAPAPGAAPSPYPPPPTPQFEGKVHQRSLRVAKVKAAAEGPPTCTKCVAAKRACSGTFPCTRCEKLDMEADCKRSSTDPV